MDRDQFIELVGRRAGVPASQRLDGMPLTDAEMAEPFDLQVFVQRVADRALVRFDAARADVRAVFQTLREAVTGDEFQDASAQLPREYAALLEGE
jgi:uncharacterized protein (DUF2267 family)